MACVELFVCFCSWLVSNCLFLQMDLCRTVLFLQMACVVLSVFTDGLCRTVCLCLQRTCVELSVFTDELSRTVCFCIWLVSNCLFLQMTCVELSVFAVGLCRTVCFCR